jgi:hypothetical protein
MAAQTRIYAVARKDATTRLIRASSAAQAIRHAVGTDYSADVATQDECIALAAKGVAVETAGEISEPAGKPAHG